MIPTGFHTLKFSFNETHNSNLTLDWGFGTIIFNSSDDPITISPTPSPTKDHQSSYDDYLYVIETNMLYL